jgi:hypothetical protein
MSDELSTVFVTEESNAELFEKLTAIHRANHKPNRITFGGAVYRVYDRGGKFVMEAQAGGMQHYDSVSMAGPNTNFKLEQGLVSEEASVPVEEQAPKPKQTKKTGKKK